MRKEGGSNLRRSPQWAPFWLLHLICWGGPTASEGLPGLTAGRLCCQDGGFGFCFCLGLTCAIKEACLGPREGEVPVKGNQTPQALGHGDTGGGGCAGHADDRYVPG